MHVPVTPTDADARLVLDANAVAGALEEIFGRDVTPSPTVCAHCGNRAALGTLLAFTQAPGVVLRCSACTEVVLRFTVTPGGICVDLRGMSSICLGTGGGG
jgi:hypothetical protein